MHYETLKNDKKVNIELPDAAFQCSSISQLTELNRTRRILLHLTGAQFVLFLSIIFGVIYAYIYGYALEAEWFHPLVRLLLIFSCICFLIGSLAVHRCDINGLNLFSKLLTLDLIITYFIVGIYIIIPICLKKYPTDITAKTIFGIGYQLIFCIVAFLPGYTIRMADKLSKLLRDNQ